MLFGTCQYRHCPVLCIEMISNTRLASDLVVSFEPQIFHSPSILCVVFHEHQDEIRIGRVEVSDGHERAIKRIVQICVLSTVGIYQLRASIKIVKP